MQRWVIEVNVADEWVADGIDLAEDDGVQLDRLLAEAYPYLSSSEVKGKVLEAPPADDIARLQGYADAADRSARQAKRRRL